MDSFQKKTAALLAKVASSLREREETRGIAAAVEGLAAGVDQPCVLAVVGTVKAGKSTFINALLGEDLAEVGVEEKTATINYFRAGQAPDGKPVRCHWRSGAVTEEGREFLARLQGNDIETLRRADGIKFLEYVLPNPLLNEVTVVDTPGTGSVIDEHQNRTAEYLNLASQMRKFHHGETVRLGTEADAIVYLFDAVARENDRELLDDFVTATGGRARAFNAVGVMAKIDVNPAVTERRQQLSAKIAGQMSESLNTVVPVSAGLRRCLDILSRDGGKAFSELLDGLRRIPPKTLKAMVSSHEIFLNVPAYPGCPLSAGERRRLYRLGASASAGPENNPPWGVFSTIVRTYLSFDGEADADALRERLSEIAGFDLLRKTLRHNFFDRSVILRCHKILNDVRGVLNTIRYSIIPGLRERERDDEARLARFLSLTGKLKADRDSVSELESFLRANLETKGRSGDLEKLHAYLDGEVGKVLRELEEFNADFGALQMLGEASDSFTEEELDELRPLLGLYGLDVENRIPPDRLNDVALSQRQLAWRSAEMNAPHGSARRLVAERAYIRYGLIWESLLQSRRAS